MSLSRARERERRLKDWSCHEHIPFPHHTQSTSCQSNPKELLVAHYYESKVHNPTKLVKLFKSLEKTLDTMLTMSYNVHLRYIRTCKFRYFFIQMIYLLVNSGKGSLEKTERFMLYFCQMYLIKICKQYILSPCHFSISLIELRQMEESDVNICFKHLSYS